MEFKYQKHQNFNFSKENTLFKYSISVKFVTYGLSQMFELLEIKQIKCLVQVLVNSRKIFIFTLLEQSI